ncbi:MAG: MATE family efflux transporter [Clostridia bacterium]|nr:MATE family efflux transporter [Clostridia bacterium]
MKNSTRVARKDVIQLSDHFTYARLARFVMPSVIMMVFTSIYGVVDGLFVSNFVGKTPFAAVNFIFPLIMILGAVGFMLGTGGTAIVAKTLGEGDKARANKYFSLIIYTAIISGTVIALIGIIFVRPIAVLMGGEGEMLDCAVLYARVVLIGLPFFMLQNSFQNFFVTAEKPKIGLFVTVAAGVTNIVCDALFVAVFRWGLAGAAAATALSQFIGGVLPLIYFSRKNTSLLRLGRAELNAGVLLRTCTNGSSELMSNISSSLVTLLYNTQLLRYAGNDGIAAYGVIMYVSFTFVAIFIGIVIGAAPIVSFNYGANNREELHGVFKKCTVIVTVLGGAMTALALILAGPLSGVFVGYDEALYELTLRGFIIYSLHYVLAGFGIFGSSFFTALNNGGISAAISFLRTLVFQCSAVLLLPLAFGIDGVWFSVLVAELLSFAVTLTFIITQRKKYGYA